MSLVSLVITLIVVGILLWVVNSYIPMDATIRKIINVLVIVVVILWVLTQLGYIENIGNIKIERVK